MKVRLEIHRPKINELISRGADFSLFDEVLTALDQNFPISTKAPFYWHALDREMSGLYSVVIGKAPWRPVGAQRIIMVYRIVQEPDGELVVDIADVLALDEHNQAYRSVRTLLGLPTPTP